MNLIQVLLLKIWKYKWRWSVCVYKCVQCVGVSVREKSVFECVSRRARGHRPRRRWLGWSGLGVAFLFYINLYKNITNMEVNELALFTFCFHSVGPSVSQCLVGDFREVRAQRYLRHRPTFGTLTMVASRRPRVCFRYLPRTKYVNLFEKAIWVPQWKTRTIRKMLL